MPNIDMDYSNPADILEHLEEIHLRSLTFDMFQETTVTRSPVYREVETRVGNMDQYQATLQAHGEFYNRLSHYASCLTDGESRVNRTPLTDPIKFANLATMAGFTQKYGAQLNAGMRPNELGDISREMIQMNFYAATAANKMPPEELSRAIDMLASGKNCVTFTPKNARDLSAGFDVTVADPMAMQAKEPAKAKKLEEPAKTSPTFSHSPAAGRAVK